MKQFNQFTPETQTDIAAAIAGGAVAAGSVAEAIKSPSLNSVPTAMIGCWLCIGLTARMVRAIKRES